MTSEQVNPRTIFNNALEYPAGTERDAFLSQACGTNRELRARVEKLLKSLKDAGDFLQSAPGQKSTVIDSAAQAKPSPVIGPYKLLQRIGEGGMGIVYMAEQTHPVKRRVALKIIKPGMDSRKVIARFQAERQALALMDHPNIAKVLDANTTEDGKPYFVMELVKGVPITNFCDQRHLSPGQRLKLFISVCHAVQHAHQKGVIHRDLKPSNVLVAEFDGKPVPKVIDFGVAKATGQKLTEQTMYTEFGAIVGTLEYMSPEQASFNQLDIDTRSDIYSLGVLLYELLTGTTPVDKKRFQNVALLEILRLIREEDPPRPSTRLSTTDELPSIAANRGLEPRKLSGVIRGELDWIVMKALEKDRNHRYESASGLANDVERYLADEPVTACPPTLAYRLMKLSRKHKPAFLIAGGAVVALVVGVIGLITSNRLITRERDNARQAVIAKEEALKEKNTALDAKNTALAAKNSALEAAEAARANEARQRERADENYRTARAAVDRLFTRLADQLQGKPGLEKIRRDLLDDALSFYRGFLREKETDPSIILENGLAYRRLADLHQLLGQQEEMLKSLEQALSVFSQLSKSDPSSLQYRGHLADGTLQYARVLSEFHRLDESAVQYEKAIEMWEELRKAVPTEPRYLYQLARCEWEFGYFWGGRYQHSKGTPHLQRCDELRKELVQRFPKYQTDLWATKGIPSLIPVAGVGSEGVPHAPGKADERDYSTLPHDEKQLREFENILRPAVAYWEQQAAEHPDVPAYYRSYAHTISNLQRILAAQKRFAEVELIAIRRREETKNFLAKFPQIPEYLVTKAWDDYGFACLKYYQGQRAEAEQNFRLAIEAEKGLISKYPGELRHHNHLLWMLISCPIAELREPQRAIEEARISLKLDGSKDAGELAVAQVRAGLYAEALESFKKIPAKNRTAMNDLFESIALWHVGGKEWGRRVYKRGTDKINSTPNKAWYTFQYIFLCKEIETMMGDTPKAEDSPKSPAKL